MEAHDDSGPSSAASSVSASGWSPSPSPSRDATLRGAPFRSRPTFPTYTSKQPALSASEADISPSASTTLRRTAETLDGIAQQLTDINNLAESEPDLARCCCAAGDAGAGPTDECPAAASRSRLEDKLKLCGEIGTVLLQRYEALDKKHTRSEQQLEIKRKALADSLRHVANLERSNTTQLAKYTELTHSLDSLEKKYIKEKHAHTLTQQALTQVRGELTKLRATEAIRVSAGGLEERLAEAEQRFEDARDLYHAESRRLRDQTKWRKMAEDRIADLEMQLTAAGGEAEALKTAREKDARDLLANAKERLQALHEELSATFHADAPSEIPEYQRTLEDLVASNALLKHDTAELSHNLALKMDENRQLREELEEARSRQPRSRPLSIDLRSGVNHMRTGSNPIVSSEFPRPMHARVASAAAPRPQHRRQSSLAPSFTSTSTAEWPSVASPPPAECSSPIIRGDSNGATVSPEQRVSPRSAAGSSGKRNSFSGGIPYTINGVVKTKRPGLARSGSSAGHRRSVQLRSLRDVSERGVGPSEETEELMVDTSVDVSADISAEMSSCTDDAGDSASEASRASRKRASVLLPTTMTSPKTAYDSLSPRLEGGQFEIPSAAGVHYPEVREKRIGRRTLLLLSKSTGVQTDPIEPIPEATAHEAPDTATLSSSTKSPLLGGSPDPDSLQHTRTNSRATTASGSTLAELIDFLSKILIRLHGVQVRTLNGRLKKQNLPGDVAHVSRATIAALQAEIGGMRHRFRHVLEASATTRRDMTTLLKLLKDVFTEVLELQGVVNDVTVNPKLAKQLRAKAFADDDAVPATQGTLGWIAAPITSWLSAPAPKVQDVQPSPTRPRKPRAAPKLQASTSATTTTVSVEFGGSGVVRRAAPATPKQSRLTAVVGGADVFADSTQPSPGGERSVSAPQRTQGEGGTAVPPSPRRHKSMAAPRRSDLLGIFAGAQVTGLPSRSPLDASPATRARMRHASSQYFGGRPVRAAEPKDRMSTIVDAVLDHGTGADEDAEPAITRTLRPRGLSDSSIRSTAIDPDSAGTAAAAAVTAISVPPNSRYSVGTGVVAIAESLGSGWGSLSRRWYRDGTAGDEDESAVEVEATPRPKRVKPMASSRLAPDKTATTTTGGGVSLAPPKALGGASTPTSPGGWRDAPRTPRTPTPALAVPATAAVAAGSAAASPIDSGSLIERLAEAAEARAATTAGDRDGEDARGLRTLSLRGSVRAASRRALR